MPKKFRLEIEEEGSIQSLSPLELIRENGSKIGMAEDNDSKIGHQRTKIFVLWVSNARTVVQTNFCEISSSVSSWWVETPHSSYKRGSSGSYPLIHT
jgi:hypothetical protein